MGRYFIFIIIIFCVVFFPVAILADMNMRGEIIRLSNEEVNRGDLVVFDLFAHADDGNYNAVDGSVEIVGEGSQIEDIFTGGSVVSHWVDMPVVDKDSQSFRFSGVSPGSFIKKPYKILSFSVRVHSAGLLEVLAKDMRLLRANGAGTPAKLGSAHFSLAVSDQGSDNLAPALRDTTAPEPFTASLETIYFGDKPQLALIFHTTDSQSGVAMYKLHNTVTGHDREIKSPYVISSFEQVKDSEVVAIDHFGNARVGKIVIEKSQGKNSQTPYAIAVILAVLIVATYYIRKKFLR